MLNKKIKVAIYSFLLVFILIALFYSGTNILNSLHNQPKNSVVGGRTDGFWDVIGTYIKPNNILGYDWLVNGVNKHINFNTVVGDSGYGIRDNNGDIEAKHSGGSWFKLAVGGGGGISLTDLSNTATGLTYNNTNGVTSLTPGYEIPQTASTSNWQTGYTGRLQWDGGNTNLFPSTGRASLGLGSMSLENNNGSTTITTVGTIGTGTWQGTTIKNGYIASSSFWKGYTDFSASNPITYNSNTGAIGWTNSNNYITLGSISASSPLSYNNGTGIFSVSSGYSIPLTASTTVWNNKQDALTFPLAANLGGTGSTSLNLNLMNDVSYSNPITNQILSWNGTDWINTDPGSVSVNASLVYYLESGQSSISSYKNLTSSPTSSSETSISTTTSLASGKVLLASFVTATTSPNRTSYDAGIWEIMSYASANNILSNTYIVTDFYRRSSGGTETFLFSATSSNINTMTPSDFSVDSIQSSFSASSTDRIVAKYYAVTNSAGGITVTLYLQGSVNASHFHTPFSAQHNDLAGLQGGANGEMYHLTQSQYNNFPNLITLSNLSSTATGLTYTNTTGVFSLTSGYEIPKTASTSNWQTAYGWGNHALAGYLTTESDPVVKALSGIITSNGSTISAITNNSSNWDTAYTDRLKWDGGSTGLNAVNGRTSLGLGSMALESNTGSTTITTLGTITALTVSGTTTIQKALVDSTGSTGTPGQLLSSTGTSTDWITIAGGGDMLKANNLSDVASSSIAANNIGNPWGTISGQIPVWDNLTNKWKYDESFLFASTTNDLTIGSSSVIKGGTDTGFAVAITDDNKNLLVLASASTTQYSRIDYQGTGRTFTSGVGNSAETAYGLANDWYVFDYTASKTRMVIDANGNVGIGTSSPSQMLTVGATTSQQFLVNNVGAIIGLTGISGITGTIDFSGATTFKIPTSATLISTSSGSIGIDTTSGQFRYNDGAATRTLAYYIAPSLTIASTSWTTSATTTIPMGVAFNAETWTNLSCFTDTATTTIRFGDGTNYIPNYTATTTPTSVSLSSNNSFAALEKRYIQIWNFTGTPNYLTCTIKKSYDAD